MRKRWPSPGVERTHAKPEPGPLGAFCWSVSSRFQAHWRLKVLLTAVVNLLFWSGYSWLGRSTFFPAWVPPRTWLDRAIPFQPEPWAWVYLSQFLVAALLPWLIGTRDMLRRYVFGLTLMSLASFAVFFVLPVASPRAGAVGGGGAMALVLAYDGAWNAFPSLHAGFLAYLGRLGWRMFGGVAPRWVWVLASGWGGAVLYATIATRQHYVVDLIAGAGLGLFADGIAWRRSTELKAVTTISRSSGVAFQDGCK